MASQLLAEVERGILEALDAGRHVPEGLEHFSPDNFGRRVQALLDRAARL